ncbi:TetR/AcrR family transcriptional regulator, partial [Mycobacterium sp. NAZ190054]|uniref:TetR/AcrR family transcriptional regulator n=1 Tax=Mycobacterium sp. NAZ190054 TaxID=1747766 RepID=UPI000B05E9FD
MTSQQNARARVLDVALTLFTRHGYAGTSLQMIADEMGVTKGALYYHFRAREDLLRALVAPLVEQLRARIDVDTRFITTPTALKLAVMVLGVLCVVAAIVALAVLD